MKIKNIIFLYSTQAHSRTDIYTNACHDLKSTYGYNVVFTYNGAVIKGIDGINSEHFETWLRGNRNAVEMVVLSDFEKKYRRSNFWRPAVIERNLTDYSFIGNAFAKSDYRIDEIEWYLKALILFYEYVIEKHRIQAAFNIVSDNIHPQILYELSRSIPIIPFAIGRGIYWFDDMFYLQTELNYTSRLLAEKYKEIAYASSRASNFDLSIVDEHLRMMRETCTRSARPTVIYSKSVGTTLRNALKSIRRDYMWITLRKPAINESNYKVQFTPVCFSLLARIYNISWIRRNITNYNLPCESYVFLPLHYQPEASILGASPGWLDQLGLVRLLSSSLPSGFRLVVKDHPATGGMREPAFYRNIMKLKNVLLLDDRVNSRAIINHPSCRLLVTIGGTTGFEGMLFGKPLLILGRAYYDCMKTLVRPPPDLNEMPNFMKDLLIHEKYYLAEDIINDARMFLAAWLSIMKPVGKATTPDPMNRAAAGKDWARVMNELVKQIEESGLYEITDANE